MKRRLLAVIFSLLCISSFAQNADINLLDKINSTSSPFADKIFLFLSNSTAPVGFGIPAIHIGLGYGMRNCNLTESGWEMAATVFTSTLLTTGLKFISDRERPFDRYDFIEHKTEATSSSFPSGHTSLAFATATTLSLAYPEWYVIAPAYLWASGVAYSRMFLGVHYPTDIIGGIIIGTGSAILIHYVLKEIIG